MRKFKVFTKIGEYHVVADCAWGAKRSVFAMTCGRVAMGEMIVKEA